MWVYFYELLAASRELLFAAVLAARSPGLVASKKSSVYRNRQRVWSVVLTLSLKILERLLSTACSRGLFFCLLQGHKGHAGVAGFGKQEGFDTGRIGYDRVP